MDGERPLSFGELLRRYRLAAGLSQEALAERARLSAQAVSALERGVKQTPYRETVRLLTRALGLPAEEAERLEAAVPRRRGPPASVRPGVAPPPPAAALRPQAEESQPASGVADPVTLPTGTLTFLLTDIEGSTTLWDRYPAAMQAALARHDALFDEVLARHGGRQVKERGEGDSIFAVFTSPSAALAAVCALQQALLAEPWPLEAPLRVRMGLHTGEAALRDGGYYGVTVNRTARIRSLACGGQVLLSQSTYDLLRDGLPEGVSLRPLGAHRLKGLAQPEEIYQVVHPHLPAAFPPLPSPTAPATNLPAQPTSFIGRAREQTEVRALLGRSALVTLTGAGGCGKTRLALEVAAGLMPDYPDGVWLVELAALADPALVLQAVAKALGVREEPGRPLLATLAAHLQAKAPLLVLDNCEHLIGACAEVAVALMRACPRLQLLTTSREALEVAGETLYRVPSLTAPDPGHLPAPAQLPRYEAVRLFLERAQARRPEFALTTTNARAVAQICARLDGMPLAIELAAARVSVLPVEGIAVRLDDRFRLLTSGPRTALPRQQTLRATLDWSYDLLGEGEQRLLDRLAVFAGGCTLAAAEAVCSGEGIEAWEVLDLLGGLVNKSLVLLEEAGGEAEQEPGRYRLLETVRQYGWERLVAAHEAAAVRDRHLAWCLALAEQARPELRGLVQGIWLARLEREHDNLRAALGWSIHEAGDAGLGQRLAGALSPFWRRRGYVSEGRGWLDAALARADQRSPSARALVLSGAGTLAWMQGEYRRAVSLYEQALGLQRALDNKVDIATSLTALADVASAQGQFNRAVALYEEALALWRAQGDSVGIHMVLLNMGVSAWNQGEYERASTLLEEALVLVRERGDTWGIALTQFNLGWVAYQQGEYGRAGALLDEALALARQLGDSWGTSFPLIGLGFVAHAQEDYARAGSLFEESLALSRRIGDKSTIAFALLGLGRIAHTRGDYGQAASLHQEGILISHGIGAAHDAAAGLEELAWTTAARGHYKRAALLGGAAEALRQDLGMRLPRNQQAGHAEAVGAMRAVLGEEAFAAAWAEGRALSLEEAIALALAAGAAAAEQGP
jgi:predicted ATPase/class 3 adenylate cyclase/Tfp pilus assembly protein PilF/DNA-binding XRE family transcriptional regulator